MAGIPNQSNINKTIKAQINDVNTAINVVVKAATGKIAIEASKNINNVKKYQDTINFIFDKKGIVNTLISSINSFNQINKSANIKLTILNETLGAIESLVNYIDSLSKLSVQKQLSKLENTVDRIIEFINKMTLMNVNTIAPNLIKHNFTVIAGAIKSLSEIFGLITSIDVPRILTLKFLKIRIGIRRVTKLINRMAQLSLLNSKASLAVIAVSFIRIFTSSINEIFASISEVKIGIKTLWKLFRIPKVLLKIRKLTHAVSKVASSIKTTNAVVNSVFILIIVKSIQNVFDTISNIKIKPFIGFKIKRIAKVVYKIRRIAHAVSKAARSIKTTNAVVNSIGIAVMLLAVNSVINTIKNIKIGFFIGFKIRRITKTLGKMWRLVFALNRVANLMRRTGAIRKAISMVVLFMSISTVFTIIRLNKVGMFTIFKLKRILKAVRYIGLIIRKLNRLRRINKTILRAMALKTLFAQLGTLFTSIVIISPLALLTMAALLVIWGTVVFLRFVMRRIVKASRVGLRAGAGLMTLSIVFLQLGLLFTSITLISPMALLAMIALLVIWGAVTLLKFVLKRIARNTLTGLKAGAKLMILSLVFLQLGLLFTSIVLISPMALLAIPAMLLIIGSVFLIEIGLKIVLRLLSRIGGAKMIKGMLFILLIGALMTALGVMLMIVASLAQPIVKSTLWIIGFVVVVGLIVLMMVGMAALLLLLTPIVVPLLAALGCIFLVIGALFLIGLMLKVIQNLGLDSDEIREKVELIMSTCMLIIDDIFRKDETETEETDKSWISSVIDFIGGSLKTIISAIVAISFLALMIVAVLLILLIAAQLKLIQELNLDPNKITTNVGVVVDTCVMIIDTIFAKPEASTKESNRSWLGGLLEQIGSSLVMVLKAILAVAFLATIIIAISLVLLIAIQLRLLQELDLDTNKISANVGIVMSTAALVVSSIFDNPDKETESSDKSWIGTVIEWFSSTLSPIINAIMAIAYLAIMIVAILLVNILALQLKTIQDIDLNPDAVTEKTSLVINTCINVVDAITNQKDKPDEESNKGWIRKLFEWVGADGILNIIDAIMALAWLGMTMAIIALVVQLAQYLSTIANIDIPTDIGTKVDNLVICANDVIDSVVNRPDPLSGKKSDSKAKKFLSWLLPDSVKSIIDYVSMMNWVSTVMSTVGIVEQVADIMLKLKKLPDLSNVKSNVQTMCNNADEIANMIIARTGADIEDGHSRLKFLERLNKVIKEVGSIKPAEIKKSKDAIASHINLIEKIDKMDIKKLETSAQLFGHMASFSKSIRGDFAQLANTLNEDLLPTIKELKDLLSETKLTLEQTTSTLEQMRELQQKQDSREDSSKTLEDFIQEVRRNNPNLGDDAVEQEARDKKRRYDMNHKDSVKSIVKDMFDLMDGKRLTVKTIP